MKRLLMALCVILTGGGMALSQPPTYIPPLTTDWARTLLDDETASDARDTLGVTIGTNVQQYSANLTTWASLAPSAFFQGLVTQATAAALCSAIGMGTEDSPQFTAVTTSSLTSATNISLQVDTDNNGTNKISFVNGLATEMASISEAGNFFLTGDIDLGHASDTTIRRTAAGQISVEGSGIVLDSDIGSTVQAYDPNLTAFAGLAGTANTAPYFTAPGAMSAATTTSFGRTQWGVADANHARPNLELPVINVKDHPYHATGNGTTDDHDAIAAAITAAQITPYHTVFFPNGTYHIDSAITIAVSGGVRFLGEAFSTIKAGTAMAALFNFTLGTNQEYFQWEHLILDCDDKANYAIYNPYGSNNTIKDCYITKALVYGVYLDNAWYALISNTKVNNGVGGIMLGTANSGRIEHCAVGINSGIGILIKYGSNVVIDGGSSIELNEVTGIYAYYARNLTIRDNYFEANADTTGWAVTVPVTATIRADVILAGAPTTSGIVQANPCEGAVLENNYTNSVADANSFCWVNGVNDLAVRNTTQARTGIPVIAKYGTQASGRITNLEMSGNYTDVNEIEIEGGLGTAATDDYSGHTWRTDRPVRRNYFPQDFLNYTNLASVGGTITRGTGTFRGQPIIDVYHNDGPSSEWGCTLDVANDYPELLGKLVWFGTWFQWTGTKGIRLYTPNGSDSDDVYAQTGVWTFRSRLYKIASDATTLSFGFMTLGNADVHVYVTPPMLCEVGTPYDDAETQPQEFREGLTVKNGAASAGFIDLYEDSDNGTNHLTIEGAASMAADFKWTLPNANPASDKYVQITPAGVWDYNTPAGGGDMEKATYDVLGDGFVDGNDTAYGVSWHDNINAPTMSSVYHKIETLGGGHDAVTVSADLDKLITLSTQALDFNNVAANKFLAGPTGGAAAKPTVRTMDVNDLPGLTSAQLAAKLTNETGTGVAVFADSPTFVDDITIAAAGVKLTGAEGTLTLLGLSGGSPEDLTIALDVEDEVQFSSSTGVGSVHWVNIGMGLDVQNDTPATGPKLDFWRGRDGTPTYNLSSGDYLGEIEFRGFHTAYQLGATIRATVDGEPGADDMPTRLTFSTSADGSSTPTERLRLDSAGNALFATTLQHNGDMIFQVDADNNGTNSFSFKAGDGTEIANLSEAGTLHLDGSIELGHASDTTIARSGAGAVTIEGVAISMAGHAHAAAYLAKDLSGVDLLKASGDTVDANTAAPTNGDTKHLSTAGQIYTFVTGKINDTAWGAAWATDDANAPTRSAVFDAFQADFTFAADVNAVKVTASGGFVGALAGKADTAGNADTVTTNANLTGDVTSVGNATTIANHAVHAGMINDGEITAAETATNMKTATIQFVIDGGGSAITTGVKGDIEIPFDCTITQVTMLADQGGAIVVDIWSDTYANYPPTDADSLPATGTPPTIAATNTKSQDSTLTDWTKALTAGNTLRYNVDSCTTITRCTVSLKVTKS